MTERASQHIREIVGDADVGAFERFMSILGEGWVRASGKTFGSVRKDERMGDSQQAVCFSEVPLGLLDRLVDRHSEWGLGFNKFTI